MQQTECTRHIIEDRRELERNIKELSQKIEELFSETKHEAITPEIKELNKELRRLRRLRNPEEKS